MNEAEQFHAIISGRVHGVGFRMFVADRASALGLRGYVRNLPGSEDWENGGQVEVIASGPHPALDALLRQLHAGPPAARILDVKVEWGSFGEFRSFEVRH
jgi:acylphosphatase